MQFEDNKASADRQRNLHVGTSTPIHLTYLAGCSLATTPSASSLQKAPRTIIRLVGAAGLPCSSKTGGTPGSGSLEYWETCAGPGAGAAGGVPG